jgi:hypothetical protein
MDPRLPSLVALNGKITPTGESEAVRLAAARLLLAYGLDGFPFPSAGPAAFAGSPHPDPRLPCTGGP